MKRPAALALVALLLGLIVTAPLAARDSLGVYGQWGAFRDAEIPRCYAISAGEESRAAREFEPFASVGTWPGQQVRGQVHFRLSRALREGAPVTLRVGTQRFALQGAGNNAWATDRAMDAAVVAAMRAAARMRISGLDARGRRFSDQYSLEGAATAMDAASVGCAG